MTKQRTSWGRICGMSVLVLIVAIVVSIFWHAGAIELLLGLFLFGTWAGWLSRRHGWLSGIIVGLPLVLLHLTRAALVDYPSLSALLAAPDYWRVAVPTSVASTGMAIMGGIVGAWLQDMRFQKTEGSR